MVQLNPQPEVVTLRILSQMFSIPLWTLRKWSAERRLPGLIKLNRSVRVDVSVFREWIQSRRVDNGGGGR